MKRTGSAIWTGNLKSGHGALATHSGVLKETPYSFASRFEAAHATNPEELIATAHAGCFTMALAANLGQAGFTPKRLATQASVSLEQAGGRWAITSVHLEPGCPASASRNSRSWLPTPKRTVPFRNCCERIYRSTPNSKIRTHEDYWRIFGHCTRRAMAKIRCSIGSA
jgi:lipoyl-dependent peroxiredoxin